MLRDPELIETFKACKEIDAVAANNDDLIAEVYIQNYNANTHAYLRLVPYITILLIINPSEIMRFHLTIVRCSLF